MKYNHVLSYWFGEKLDDPELVAVQYKRWFIASKDLDRELRDRFAGLQQVHFVVHFFLPRSESAYTQSTGCLQCKRYGCRCRLQYSLSKPFTSANV